MMNEIAASFLEQPLLISRTGLHRLFAQLDAASRPGTIEPPGSILNIRDGVAEISIAGVLTLRPTPLMRALGFVGVDQIGDAINAAYADPNVKRVLLRVDSPGGSVSGIAELADVIAKNVKPVTAFSDSELGSAAYWLAAGASSIICSPSAMVGSVGVVVGVRDVTGALANAGIKIEQFTSGSLKGAGFSGTSLSDAQRQHLQAGVDLVFGKFWGHVAKYRRRISDVVRNGGEYFGWQAIGLGLVDSLQNRFDATGSSTAGNVSPFEAEFRNTPALQAEFGTLQNFLTFRLAEASGRVHISQRPTENRFTT